jgi:hypothetical protein
LVNELNLDLEIEEPNEDAEQIESTLDETPKETQKTKSEDEEDEGYDMTDADKDPEDDFERDENERD